MTDGRLAPHLTRRRARRLPRSGRLNHTRRNCLARRRVRVEVLLQFDPNRRGDQGARFGVVEPVFGLPLKLRVDHEQVEDDEQALSDVVTRYVELFGQQLVRVHVRPHGAADGVFHALLVRAAVARRDPVDERTHRLARRFGPLHRHLDAGAVDQLGLRDGKRFGLNGARVVVLDQRLQKLVDAALVNELDARSGLLVLEHDFERAVEIRLDLERLRRSVRRRSRPSRRCRRRGGRRSSCRSRASWC